MVSPALSILAGAASVKTGYVGCEVDGGGSPGPTCWTTAGGLSWHEASEKLATPVPHLKRKLRGEVPLTRDDLLRWPLEFGVDLVPALDERDALLP